MPKSLVLASFSLWMTACAMEPSALREPPRLTVTSPERATVRGQAGAITVTGQVAANQAGDRVAQVTVNGVAAQLAADGAFTAQVQLAPGATFLHTVARDVAGGEATDTRTVHAGQLRSGDQLIDHGLAVALSDDALATVASAASTMMKTMDFAPMLAPMNPMVSKGAEEGEDCLWGKVYVDDLQVDDARLALVPKAGGLTFEAELTNLEVPARTRYEVLCANGATAVRMSASKVLVKGTMRVTPRASGQGFDVAIVSPQVSVTGFSLDASGLPGDILTLLRLDSAIGAIAAAAAERFMGPLMNQALGSLAGPKQVMVAGQQVTFEVATDSVDFDVAGAKVGLDSRMFLAGHNAQYVYTPNDPLVLEAGTGFALALSDDAANQLLASVTAAGMLSVTLPAPGGTFDSVKLTATLPPMISADSQSGKLRLLAGDLRMAFLAPGGAEVAHVALHISAEVAAVPSLSGVALQVDKPEVFADVLDNVSGYSDEDKEIMIKLVVDHQVKLMSLLLGNVPLPAVAGVRMTDTRVSAGAGFVKVTGALQ